MRFIFSLLIALALSGCTRSYLLSYGVNYLCNLDPMSGAAVKTGVDTMTSPHQVRIKCHGKEDTKVYNFETAEVDNLERTCYREIIPEYYDPAFGLGRVE